MSLSEKYKQVIVIRTDLKMKAGKKCAQACHASLSSSEIARSKNMKIYKEWKRFSGQRKIVLKIQSEEEMLALYRKVLAEGLPTYLVADAGLTQLEPGTITALGIGPYYSNVIDKFCKDLKLL